MRLTISMVASCKEQQFDVNVVTRDTVTTKLIASIICRTGPVTVYLDSDLSTPQVVINTLTRR